MTSAALSPSLLITLRRWTMTVTQASLRDAAALLAFVAVLAASDIPRSALVAAATSQQVNGAFLTAAAVCAVWFMATALRQATTGARVEAWVATGDAAGVLLRALVFVPLGSAPSAAQGVARAVFQALA